MAKGVKTVKIDDEEFELTQLGGYEGVDLFDRLTFELGPGIVGAIQSALVEGKGNVAEAKIALMALEGMVRLPGDFKMELRQRFAVLTKVKAGNLMLALGDGKPFQPDGTFDQFFAGRFGLMTKWLLACLKWSFQDFLANYPESAAPPATPTQ